KSTHRIVAEGANTIDEAVYKKVRIEAAYRLSAPITEGFVKVKELGKLPMRLIGIDYFAEPPFRNYLSNAWDGVTLLAQPNAMTLSRPLAERKGIKLGDEVTLSYSGKKMVLQVAGLLEEQDGLNTYALSNVVIVDIATAQEVLGMVGQLSYIDLLAEEGDLPKIQKVLPKGVHIVKAASQNNTVQQMMGAFNLNLSILSLLALIVGMFLVYNTINFSVIQRRSLFGILRSLGVTNRQLFWLILTESAVLAVIGSGIGICLGVFLGRSMVDLITQTMNNFYFVANVTTLEIPARTLVKGLVLGGV
ncbi:MAG: FtsX-like permease family protein, partial [Bacteroidota bacterium]